jgi:hypothetical protein
VNSFPEHSTWEPSSNSVTPWANKKGQESRSVDSSGSSLNSRADLIPYRNKYCWLMTSGVLGVVYKWYIIVFRLDLRGAFELQGISTAISARISMFSWHYAGKILV